VTIGLDPDPFVIATQGAADAGEGSITIDPNVAGGQDYADNRADIDDVTLTRLRLEIVALNAANVAAQLEYAALEITDESLTPTVTHRYLVSPTLLPLPIVPTPLPEDYYDLGALEADPVDPAGPLDIHAFLSSILRDGHTFTVRAQGLVDAGPVDITCRLHLDVDLHVSVGIF